MRYTLEGRRFKAIVNAPNGEVGAETVFAYHQDGNIIWADYSGGIIVRGHPLGTMQSDGTLDFRYHHVNRHGQIMIGTCRSTPETLPDGRLRFHEKWKWITGDQTDGISTIEELPAAAAD